MARERMIVVRLSALGDVAMTIPAIYSLAWQYPELDIHVVTRPFFAKLFINRPGNVSITEADFKNANKGASGFIRLLRQLSHIKPQYVADLHNVLRSWIIDSWMQIHGTKVAMVDKNRRSRRKLFSDKQPQRNYIDRYADVFSRLGFPIDLTFRSVFDRNPAISPFEPRHTAVGVAPFARYYNKTYPPEMMYRAVEMMCHAGCNVYLFGGRGKEESELNNWAEEIPGCRSVAGVYTIDKEIALMSRMDIMVSMDSANQHLASLSGTKVISIWGSTTPACGFMAYGQSVSNAIVLGLPCQPCSVAGKPICPLGHLDCLCKIAPRTIADKVVAELKTDGKL